MGASQTITDEVLTWPGVQAGPGRRGEYAFTVGRRQLGHLHGDHAAHFSFPKPVWSQLFEEGRIAHHPVFPGKEGPAARRIESDDDVRDVIALLRLNYDRVILRGLAASPATPLPFAPSLVIRAFVLRRAAGNVLIYSAPGVDADGIERAYLNHWHEAAFGGADLPGVPLFVHEDDREQAERTRPVRATFSRRHMLDGDLEVIPTPGHTPGATAFLWDNGEHRFLFTGDTLYLRDGEWVAAVLDSSDRGAYLDSLDLLRELDFDVLVPWAASAGQPHYAMTSPEDAHRRIGRIIDRIWRGDDH